VIRWLDQPGSDTVKPPVRNHRCWPGEWFYVLDGELTVWVDGQLIGHQPDHSCSAPKTPHTFTVSSEGGARFLLVTEPTGFEAFVRTCAELAQSRTLPHIVTP
jgi:uncharacterized cupin superfamily protein